MRSKIPMRPEGFMSNLPQAQQTCLTWYVLSGCSRKEAFVTFARPDMLESKAKAAFEDYVKQFFANRDVKDYIEAYEKTLDNFLNPAQTKSKPKGTMEERKAQAKTRATEFAMSLAENIDQADDPEYVLKLMDKVGLLDGDEEVEELPRRYLPVGCNDCEYRKFVEENCERIDSGT